MGGWSVDIDHLPAYMRHRADLAWIRNPRELLHAHRRELLRSEALEDGVDADGYVQEMESNPNFLVAIARKEAEGKYGGEIQHARLLHKELERERRRR